MMRWLAITVVAFVAAAVLLIPLSFLMAYTPDPVLIDWKRLEQICAAGNGRWQPTAIGGACTDDYTAEE
jgi:hypothetical protein